MVGYKDTTPIRATTATVLAGSETVNNANVTCAHVINGLLTIAASLGTLSGPAGSLLLSEFSHSD